MLTRATFTRPLRDQYLKTGINTNTNVDINTNTNTGTGTGTGIGTGTNIRRPLARGTRLCGGIWQSWKSLQ